ncbi:MAG: flippase-like domain-containing protein [Labilithrix sp.]|nr:flippase-like domain-containing protein [Labilithrix sp.]MCW5810797.1 flippase-like domain-containing protein [Labilithrix sp.]
MEAKKPQRSARSTLLFVAKIAVASALIGWLVKSRTLDFGALGIFFRRPLLLVLDLALFGFGVVIASLRYRVLLGLAGIRFPLARLIQLQLTAVFFNVVIPGSVGGDVVKALYVAREVAPLKRTTLLLIAFVERLLGLAGLIVIATLVTLVRFPTLFGDPLLRPTATTVLTLGAGTVLGAGAFLLFIRVGGARLESWTSGPSAISKVLNQLVAATRLLVSGPRELVVALGLSMTMHAAGMAFFTLLTVSITGQDVAYATVATVFPLGVLTMVLPVAPAGLGVAHVAFERLFSAVGLTGGATVFNVYLLGSITPSLLGVFPYLALKRRGELPT